MPGVGVGGCFLVLGGVRLRVGVGLWLWSRGLMVSCFVGVGDTRWDGVGVRFGVCRLNGVGVWRVNGVGVWFGGGGVSRGVRPGVGV